MDKDIKVNSKLGSDLEDILLLSNSKLDRIQIKLDRLLFKLKKLEDRIDKIDGRSEKEKNKKSF